MVSEVDRTARVAREVILALALVILPLTSARSQGESSTILITLQTKNTSVVEVLDILAERSGLNIVTGPTVQGRSISIRVQSTPFEEALNLVCRASGLGYERVGGSIGMYSP